MFSAPKQEFVVHLWSKHVGKPFLLCHCCYLHGRKGLSRLFKGETLSRLSKGASWSELPTYLYIYLLVFFHLFNLFL